MDYSTISNKTNYTEVEEITNGELSERYYLLKKQFDNLSHSYETTKQELHDTKRSYQTALDVQSHLNAELETLQADQERKKNEVSSRITSLQDEISQLREERSETIDRHTLEIKKYVNQIQGLKEEQALKSRESPVRDNSELDEARAAVNAALQDAAAAKGALEELQLQVASWRMKTEELVSELGEMRVAADLRREELRAASDREATALAELAEARAMLHQHSDAQDLQPHAAKGNSIFAEVEDKRQEMAKSLIQMKQTNSRLRRELASRQAELAALQQEKLSVWELQAGAAASHDRDLIESYEERITQLEGLCERQRRELARWFGRLGAAEPAQPWLPAVLGHLKSECERLRAEVLSRGAAQLASAAQVRDLRRKLALTAAGHTLTPPNKHDTTHETSNVDIPSKPIPAAPQTVVAKKLTVDDVKKKVSFN